jgi:hypothetical protein
VNIEITMDEILEDLCHNGLPPGRWNVPGLVQDGSDQLKRESAALEACIDLGRDRSLHVDHVNT